MQSRDGRHKAQAEPRARLRAALVQPHEALQDPLAIVSRNAGALVCDDDLDRMPRGSQADCDRRRWSSRAGVRCLDRVLDRIVDEIGDGLTLRAGDSRQCSIPSTTSRSMRSPRSSATGS